jgi:predicted regulator of Ras-like GTPase activity (Roadblock/LC7/MglB family)
MSDSILKTLRALKDVQGTRGSFVLNGDGKLLAMEMPALFEASMFTDLGPRIERLAETFSALGDEMESCLIRFSDHMLCVKQFPKGGALCILTDGAVNLPALKMAVNLAHRRLAPEVANAEAMTVEAPAPVEAAPPPPPEEVAPVEEAPPRPAPRAPVYYRGQLVEG